MAGFEDIQEGLRRFNQKYKTDFSFEGYELAVMRNRGLREVLSGSGQDTPENGIYKTYLALLFKSAMQNVYRSEIKPFKVEDMINEFEDVMEDYRTHYKGQEKPLPAILGGMRGKVELYEMLERQITDLRRDKAETVKARYLAGKFPLRAMRAELAELDNANSTTFNAESISNIMVYAEALKRTVESRSGFWKRFHFIRSAAEQRDLKAMNEFLEEVKDAYPEMYAQAEEFAKEDVMTDVRREIKAAKNAILGKKQPSADVQRERANGNERRRDAAKGAQDKTRARKSAVPSSKVADELFDDTAVKNETIGKIYDMIGKSTIFSDRFRMEAAKGELYPFMSRRIMEMWEKFNTAQEIDRDVVMDNQTCQLFGFVYERLGAFGKDVKERLVITQKLCDMMMKRYSPAASDEKYEKYGESYAIDAISTADLKKITGYEGSTIDLINDVKKDLARESVSVASEDEKAKIGNAKIEDKKIEEKVLGSDMVNSK